MNFMTGGFLISHSCIRFIMIENITGRDVRWPVEDFMDDRMFTLKIMMEETLKEIIYAKS